jgi:hypothetical protein
MKTTISLGDLVATAFDEASRASNDPREVTALATQTIEQLLRRANRVGPLQRSRR